MRARVLVQVRPSSARGQHRVTQAWMHLTAARVPCRHRGLRLPSWSPPAAQCFPPRLARLSRGVRQLFALMHAIAISRRLANTATRTAQLFKFPAFAVGDARAIHVDFSDAEKVALLGAALDHVPQLSWTEDALLSAARHRGLSVAAVGAPGRMSGCDLPSRCDPGVDCLRPHVGLAPRGPVEIVEYFNHLCDTRFSSTVHASAMQMELSGFALLACFKQPLHE